MKFNHNLQRSLINKVHQSHFQARNTLEELFLNFKGNGMELFDLTEKNI